MSDRIREWLDESQLLAYQTTEGPWEVCGFNVLAHLGPGNCNGCSGTLSPAHLPECRLYEVAGAGKLDAEFIAEARTRLPQAVAALRAVVELHRPMRDYGGTACAECEQSYPCLTVLEVEAALEGDNDD